MNEESNNQKQQQQQQQHVTSWPGKQVETLRLWEEAVKARKKGKHGIGINVSNTIVTVYRFRNMEHLCGGC